MKYKAIITDIDGTLVPIASHKTSKKVKDAIAQLHTRHIPISIATGRPFVLITTLVHELKLHAPVIVDNGAALYDPTTNQPIYEATINHDVANEILHIIHNYNTHYHVSFGTQNKEELEDIPVGVNVRKFVIHQLIPQYANKLVKQIEEKFKTLHVSLASANEGKEYLDVYISDGSASKQHAVVKLAHILNISPHEIIGVGDHYNDFPLLMACGLKVAMGNAIENLKAIADFIAPPVEEDGLATVIEKYLLQ